MKFEPWLPRHHLCSFLVLEFGISWGGILIVMGSADFNLVELRPLDTGLFFVFMLLGPSASGLALTALLEGHTSLRRLVTRMAHWRLGLRWYGVALLTMPLQTMPLLALALRCSTRPRSVSQAKPDAIIRIRTRPEVRRGVLRQMHTFHPFATELLPADLRAIRFVLAGRQNCRSSAVHARCGGPAGVGGSNHLETATNK